MGQKAVLQQIERFPEGQFVALHEGRVVGMAATMRTSRSPYQPSLEWMAQIGDMGIRNHEPNGDWLYGVEFTVHPEYQRRGVGRSLYRARFNLVRELNLKGFHMVGMLMGYYRYRDTMSIPDYAHQVMNKELRDPTVSMQMHRGFTPIRVVENYLDEPQASGAGVHMVWYNPDYQV
jgi:GNAT superfamily N-acetyltransferase